MRLKLAFTGCRFTPLKLTGYRPDLNIGNMENGKPTINGASVVESDKEWINDGEKATIWIQPLAPQLWNGVVEGMEISSWEGPKMSGYGRVLEIVR